jgi:hypothetical protein
MKKKIIITEEQLKYIVDFIGKEADINEQVKVDLEGPKKSLNVKTPVGGLSISHTAGHNKSGSIKKPNTFVNRIEKAKETNNKAGLNLINKTVNEDILPKANIVRKTLSDENQIKLWDEILKTEVYFAADIIDYVMKHSWVKQTVLGKNDEKGEEVDPGVPGEKEPKFPGLNITTPIETNTSDYYPDNSWTLTPAGVKDIEESFVQPILEQKKNSKKSCVNYIKIDTSASRFRNTKGASDLTFEELSKKRSESTYQYLMGRLKEIGITEWCSTQKVELNYNGENGDGTSGPNPPSGNYYVPKGGVSSKAVLDDKNRNEFGTPHNSKVEYDVHKYNRVNVGLAFDFSTPPVDGTEIPPKIKEPVPNDGKKYNVKFYGKTKGKWDIDWNKIFYKPSGGRPRKASKSVVACPKWGGGDVQNWIDRGLKQK